MGTPLRTILFDLGGGVPPGHQFKAAQTGLSDPQEFLGYMYETGDGIVAGHACSESMPICQKSSPPRLSGAGEGNQFRPRRNAIQEEVVWPQ